MTEPARPFVSIVVPVLNEETYIAQCLASLLDQGRRWKQGSAFEVLVMDGGSIDRTREIVRAISIAHPEVQLMDNPGRLQSAAMNLAARSASPRATVLVRADAHVGYPRNFLEAVVGALAERQVPSVVVPMVAVGHRGFQRAVAAAQNSIIGNGGSTHRRASASAYVDHGHHAAFNRAFFLELGGYDESFSHNEDAEYDHRVSLAGGRVWLCGDAVLTYFPRSTPGSLARQYVRHGAGRACTLLLHRMVPRLRQMIPPMILLASVGALVLAPLAPAVLAIPMLYAVACIGYGAAEAVRQRDGWLLATGPAAMIMHLGWGSGFLRACLGLGLFGKLVKRRQAPPDVTLRFDSHRSAGHT